MGWPTKQMHDSRLASHALATTKCIQRVCSIPIHRHCVQCDDASLRSMGLSSASADSTHQSGRDHCRIRRFWRVSEAFRRDASNSFLSSTELASVIYRQTGLEQDAVRSALAGPFRGVHGGISNAGLRNARAQPALANVLRWVGVLNGVRRSSASLVQGVVGEISKAGLWAPRCSRLGPAGRPDRHEWGWPGSV